MFLNRIVLSKLRKYIVYRLLMFFLIVFLSIFIVEMYWENFIIWKILDKWSMCKMYSGVLKDEEEINSEM